jgi:hypothetical protein
MSQHRLFHSIVVGSQLLLTGALTGCFAEVVVQDPDPNDDVPSPDGNAGLDAGLPEAGDAETDPRACAPGWHPTKGTMCKMRDGRPASEQVCCGGAPTYKADVCCLYQKPTPTPPAPSGKP